ncbi:MAG TPA: glycosyltransferase family 2 protein [Bdellovibrionales bacterium]|nr:glycosyltransferase family 2 protein [Bdellovibrionales bacterium]
MARPPISLVVITLNEAQNIERCLKSVPFADDIVVLDSGSQDDTAARAKKLGARVFIESFRGYREQKVRATALARHDWIVSLDADEALSPELAGEILEKFDENRDGFEMPRLSYHLGRWIRHGGWYPDWQLRFFHRGRCQWVGGHIHERLSGKNVLRLQNPIHHWVFKDLADQVDTNNDYSSRGARDLFDRGQKFSWSKLLFKPLSKFLETYVWKRGFLDGTEGFIIAVGAAYSVFLKYAKLRELRRAAAPKQRP